MSFGKSKVSRFGSKPETPLTPQRTSTSEFSCRSSRESGRSSKICISGNGVEQQGSPSDEKPDLANELAKMKLIKTSLGKHSCLSSKIGRPNLHTLRKPPMKSTSKDAPLSEGGSVMEKESGTTLDSCKSGPPTSRIPTVLTTGPPSRPGSLGNSRASSFVSSPKAPDYQKRNLEMQFNMKSKRLLMMKKDLLEKQKPAVELHKTLVQLKNKYKEIEGKELPLEDLKVVEYPEIKTDEKQKEQDEEQLQEMKVKLQSVPLVLMDICKNILDEKCGILDKIFDDENEWTQDVVLQKIQSYKQESNLLQGQIEGKLKEEEGKLRELIKDWYQIAKAHTNEENVDDATHLELTNKLHETELKLKDAIGELHIEKTKKYKELFDKHRDNEKELQKLKEKLLEANKNLEEEKTKMQSLRDRHTLVEQKAKSAKNRMKEAESQRGELLSKIQELTDTIKKNEEEWKSKEIYLEARQKELQQVVKTHKDEIEKLESDRQSVTVRLEEQLQEYATKEKEYESKIQQLENSLSELKVQKANIETEYDLLRVKSVNSDVCNHTNIMNKKKLDYDDAATKSAAETALWQELTETRSALKLAEEKISIYAEEKTRFLNTISENYKEDDNILNVTAQLMQKEELVSTLILHNKQLQESLIETQTNLEERNEAVRNIENKLRSLNQQLFATDENSGKQIYELHQKLDKELQRNKELENRLLQANSDNETIKEMIQDYENLLKIRDGLLNMLQEKRQSTEDQNKSLKDYIVQMRDQLNLLSIDKAKKEQELKTLSVLLDKKTCYIDKIEERVAELEASVQEIKYKRPSLMQNIVQPYAPLQLQQRSRENLEQFINHAQNLCNQEVNKYRRRLRSNLSANNGPIKSATRTQSSLSCNFDNPNMDKIVTTVSDIIRRYKSNEDFDFRS